MRSKAALHLGASFSSAPGCVLASFMSESTHLHVAAPEQIPAPAQDENKLIVLDILNNEEFTVDMISKLQIFLQTKTSLEILIHWLNFLIECKDRIENASSEEEMKIIYSHFKIELETKPKG